jgi:hypothetical protein
MISIDVKSLEAKSNEVIVNNVIYPNNISLVDSIPSELSENYLSGFKKYDINSFDMNVDLQSRRMTLKEPVATCNFE